MVRQGLQRAFTGLALAAMVLAAAGESAAIAASDFDGRWTVTLRSDGQCGTTRAVVVEVSNGKVTYAGQEQVTATGTVPSSGKVKLRFVYNKDQMDAYGSVQMGTGSGSWKSNTNCQGTWSARKSG